MNFKLILALLLYPLLLAAQNTQISGTVSAKDGEPLAFVSIIASGDQRVVAFSDIEGHFSFDYPGKPQSILFKYVGFTEYKITNLTNTTHLKIILSPADLSLNEVEIIAGENPADIIMRKAIANRHRNNPERNGSYQCETYNKISFEALPDREVYEKGKTTPNGKKNFDQLEANMLERQLFLMESVTERTYLAPNFIQERVIYNRVSGFKNAEAVALANAIQPFSFYGDYLPVLDKKFLNPVSPGSNKKYFFEMKDTLASGTDTVWVIAFRPRKGKPFMALKGVLHIHSNGFAISHAKARPAFGNENFDMVLEQAYQRIPNPNDSTDYQWFPQQLNFELTAARYPAPGVGLKITGHSFIRTANPFASISLRNLNPEQPLIMEKKASTRDSAIWEAWQAGRPLSNREKNTYSFLDSLGNAKKFDRMAKIISALSTGIWPLTPSLGLNINKLVQFNGYENTRIGVGITNAQNRPLGRAKTFEWTVDGGYGVGDKKWKENAAVLWRVHRGWQTQVRLGFQNDLLEPGTAYELSNTRFFDRSLYARRMDYMQQYSAQLSTRLGKLFTVAVTASNQHLTPGGYTYSYKPREEFPAIQQFHFNEITGYLRFAYGEQNRSFLALEASTQRLPVIELAYTQGEGSASYHRVLATIHQAVFVPRVGYLQWRIEGGLASPDAPMAKLFTLNQTGGGFTLFAVNQTFQALPDTLFLHHKFVNIYLSQEIGPVFYQHKRSAPFLSIIQNTAWGQLDNPEIHRNIGFLSMNRPYSETGIRLDNLLRFNYVNFGWIGIGSAVFYRWGSYANSTWKKNIVPRLSIKFML